MEDDHISDGDVVASDDLQGQVIFLGIVCWQSIDDLVFNDSVIGFDDLVGFHNLHSKVVTIVFCILKRHSLSSF